ncbi:9114_t:CDS:2 [Entrophospora sp. SA101]|nr:9114_t:CDS:2 [Entrophospora sp. SA101]
MIKRIYYGNLAQFVITAIRHITTVWFTLASAIFDQELILIYYTAVAPNCRNIRGRTADRDKLNP